MGNFILISNLKIRRAKQILLISNKGVLNKIMSNMV